MSLTVLVKLPAATSPYRGSGGVLNAFQWHFPPTPSGRISRCQLSPLTANGTLSRSLPDRHTFAWGYGLPGNLLRLRHLPGSRPSVTATTGHWKKRKYSLRFNLELPKSAHRSLPWRLST